MCYAMEAAMCGKIEEVNLKEGHAKDVKSPLVSFDFDFGLDVCIGVLVAFIFVFRDASVHLYEKFNPQNWLMCSYID